MTISLASVTVVTHFQVHDGKLEDFKAGCNELVKLTSNENKCVFMDVAFDGHRCISHERYTDASGVMDHLQNVRTVMEKNMKLADLKGVELYSTADELDKLRAPLGVFNPDFYVVDFRSER